MQTWSVRDGGHNIDEEVDSEAEGNILKLTRVSSGRHCFSLPTR